MRKHKKYILFTLAVISISGIGNGICKILVKKRLEQSITIIGGADGPTCIFLAGTIGNHSGIYGIVGLLIVIACILCFLFYKKHKKKNNHLNRKE